jgi:deoxycytidylate deaminase
MRYLELAHKLTSRSCAKQQRMAAVVLRGGAVISQGWNRGWNHAERRAIRPHMDLAGATIYIMRHNRRCSRPCIDCQQIIIDSGIRRAVYISLAGNVVTETYSKRIKS